MRERERTATLREEEVAHSSEAATGVVASPFASQPQLFRTIAERAPFAIALIDPASARIRWANDACARFVGSSQDGAALAGRSISEVAGPSATLLLTALAGVARDRSTFADPELSIGGPHGDSYWRVSIAPFADDASSKSTDAILMAFDVTDERTARIRQQDLLVAKAALVESEQRYRKMGDLIPFGFWLASATGSMEYMGDSFLELTGTTQEEMRGDGWTRALHEDDRAQTLESWKRSCAGENLWDHEHRVRAKDGHYFTILSRGVPIRDESGTIRSWAGINLDVTDRKRFVSELKAAKETAEAASLSKDKFLAALSHELRTPLSPVLTAVHILEEEPTLTDDARGAIQIIRRNTELEARLIDDLLDLTRIVRGKLQLNREETDLHAILRNVAASCSVDAVAKGLTFYVRLEASASRAFADPARMQQAFWNLVRNAIKFTPNGGMISIETRNEGPENDVVILVRDTGVGIDAGALAKVFDAFEQESFPAKRLFGGLGLGLAINKALIEMHGGTIEARSDGKDRGSSFTVRLPSTREGASETSDRTNGVALTKTRILLVDDHRDTCQLMMSMLQRRGFDVLTAESVGEALDVAKVNSFDVLVSDLGLPDASGLDLVRALAERGHVRAIAITGYGREEDVRLSREAGFAEHLTKPVSFPKLEAAIRRLVTA